MRNSANDLRTFRADLDSESLAYSRYRDRKRRGAGSRAEGGGLSSRDLAGPDSHLAAGTGAGGTGAGSAARDWTLVGAYLGHVPTRTLGESF